LRRLSGGWRAREVVVRICLPAPRQTSAYRTGTGGCGARTSPPAGVQLVGVTSCYVGYGSWPVQSIVYGPSGREASASASSLKFSLGRLEI